MQTHAHTYQRNASQYIQWQSQPLSVESGSQLAKHLVCRKTNTALGSYNKPQVSLPPLQRLANEARWGTEYPHLNKLLNHSSPFFGGFQHFELGVLYIYLYVDVCETVLLGIPVSGISLSIV